METHAESGFILIDCQLHVRAKTPNKAKEDSGVTGRTTAKKPVRGRRRKKNRSPSALARSRKRHARFLEKKLAGKPDLASPEEDQQNSNNSVCVKNRKIPVLLVVVTGTWCLRKNQHQAQLLILTFCR